MHIEISTSHSNPPSRRPFTLHSRTAGDRICPIIVVVKFNNLLLNVPVNIDPPMAIPYVPGTTNHDWSCCHHTQVSPLLSNDFWKESMLDYRRRWDLLVVFWPLLIRYISQQACEPQPGAQSPETTNACPLELASSTRSHQVYLSGRPFIDQTPMQPAAAVTASPTRPKPSCLSSTHAAKDEHCLQAHMYQCFR